MEVKNWTYDEFPEFHEELEGVTYVPTTGKEVGAEYYRDVVYLNTAETGGPEAAAGTPVELHLQILTPVVRNHPELVWPALVFVQGSAWMKQRVASKVGMLGRLAEKGFVIATVEYRHSGTSAFPAQVQDARDAVRFLRASHEKFHIDPDQIILGGDSSGGHVAMFAGILPDGHELDDTTRIPGVSAKVNGIIDLYGSVSLLIDDGYPTTLEHHQKTSPEGMMMGHVNLLEHPELRTRGTVETYEEELKQAPPVLIAHGTKDRTVGTVQSVSLYQKMKALGCDVQLYLIEGADHGGPAFWTEEMCDLYEKFMDYANRTAGKEQHG